MRVIEPIEIITFLTFQIAAALLLAYGHLGVAAFVSLFGWLAVITMAVYRTISFLIAFLTEVAPSVAVIQSFMKKLG